MELRPYQIDLVNKLREKIQQGIKRVVCVSGCGSGKSVMAAHITKCATDKGNRVLFIVHRKELCWQITNTFKMHGVDMSLCRIAMVQTISRIISRVTRPDLIIIDECHHSLSASYRKILDEFPDTVVTGFSATPCRLNEGGLGAVFQTLVEGVSTRWLIDNHFLADYKYYGISVADTSNLHVKNGEFDKSEVDALMNQNYVFGSAVDNWMKYAKGKQTIIYCSSITTSKATADVFSREGIVAYHLDGKTSQNERERVVEAFRNGEVTVLCNVDLFGEGFDVPDCECVVLLRPTHSLALHIQQSMRSMRYKEGKTAIILDHVQNYLRHGLPDDKREWTLETKKKGEKTHVTVKQCKECFSVFPTGATVCPYCGAELIVSRDGKSGSKVIEEIMLEEISHKSYYEYQNCKTFEELDMFRKAKKYKFNWTIHKCQELGIPIPKQYAYYMFRNGWRR